MRRHGYQIPGMVAFLVSEMEVLEDVGVDYRNLDYGVSLHFATIASNNGHDGVDGSVFYHNDEIINDFAHRAVHVQTVIGKQIVDAYYGYPHHHSYYLGCSTGGRQGVQAALRYPDDFNGIVAGAPATNWNRLLGWAAMLARYVGAPQADNSPSFIPPALWDIIAREILNQCDGLDGLQDGIITEPDDCDFQPETLLCIGDAKRDCLAQSQIDALTKVYQPLFDAEGEYLFPRYDPGTEADGNAQEAMGGSVISYTNDWYRYTIFNDSSYNFSTFSTDDITLADRINPGGISTFDGDLSQFMDRGGKFLTYHGRRDELIPSGNAKLLYELVSKTLGLSSLDHFYRLFLIPGMNHCTSGPGAGSFGQLGIPSNVANVSTHNVLLAMVDWVEDGVPPDTIVGTAIDGSQRLHCRYPQRSVWNGRSFVCREERSLFVDASGS
ncbi:hypothetical protein H0H92_003792 [Tricholoma furcatifolium]|nr:hypothetical protein H0H92_003792 [Tricholoma furcatifolium]